MTIDDTLCDHAPQADEPATFAAADGGPEAASGASSDQASRSHWDKVLAAAVLERA